MPKKSLQERFQEETLNLLKLKDMNRLQLAEQVGIYHEAIYNVLKGKRKADLELVELIANALQVDPAQLLFPDESSKPVLLKPTPLEALKIVKEALEKAGYK